MRSINVPLGEDLEEFVESRISRRGYASAGDYLRALILDDQKRQARLALEAKLRERPRGPSADLDGDAWDSIEREARERLERERSRR